jgi:hypothetical protein
MEQFQSLYQEPNNYLFFMGFTMPSFLPAAAGKPQAFLGQQFFQALALTQETLTGPDAVTGLDWGLFQALVAFLAAFGFFGSA